jgi:membrane fusion protein (multidrug efflux system)
MSLIGVAMVTLALPACHQSHAGDQHHEGQKIVVTSPMVKDVAMTQPYVCQIHSQRHISVKALQDGYLEAIEIKEGQAVKAGDVMFRVIPILYKARLDAELAEVQYVQTEYNNTIRLLKDSVVSPNEVALFQAKLEKAKAKAKLAEAEYNFTTVRAPFDGIIDKLHEQQGSLVKKEDILTTLSDNSLMWVYFNVPEARYLEYMTELSQHKDNAQIELMLANGTKYAYSGKIGAIEAKFNNKTGNLAFRADFPNPDRLLRHGQTGTILINRTHKDAIVIPQRATFEIMDKRYVYVVGADNVAHQRMITIQHELDDIFILKVPPTEEQIKKVVAKAKQLASEHMEIREAAEKEVDQVIGRTDREAVQRAMRVVEGDAKKAEAIRKVLEIQGLEPTDKIVLEGVREVHDGQKVECEFMKPEEALENQKFRAE